MRGLSEMRRVVRRGGRVAACAWDRDCGPVQTTPGVRVRIATFEEWWAPFSFAIGPAGEYVASLPDGDRARLRARCVELLPDEPLEIVGVARVATSRRA